MLLVIAIVAMMVAVTLYTIGVFWEKKSGTLTKGHLVVFWGGLIFDTTGTTAMSKISNGFTLNIHGVTGLIALILMLLHVLWATWVGIRGSEKQKQGFHKYSMFVWLFWLIPFFIGMYLNM